MEERRVRFTDDYVPGPEDCPVWMIQKTWTQSSTAFVRAKTENDAMAEYEKYYAEHPDTIDDPKYRDDYENVELNIYYHMD